MSVYGLSTYEVNVRLLNLAVELSPDGIAQRGFSEIMNQPGDPDDITLALLGALSDGLRHGNWPHSKVGN